MRVLVAVLACALAGSAASGQPPAAPGPDCGPGEVCRYRLMLDAYAAADRERSLAALLHTDAALAILSTDRARSDFHLDIAAKALERGSLRKPGVCRPLARRWHVALARYLGEHAAYRQAIARHPDAHAAYLGLSEVLRRLGRGDQSRQVLESPLSKSREPRDEPFSRDGFGPAGDADERLATLRQEVRQ